jgi:hypothetical protein
LSSRRPPFATGFAAFAFTLAIAGLCRCADPTQFQN